MQWLNHGTIILEIVNAPSTGPHPFEVLHGTLPGTGIDGQLHLGDLLVDLLHEVNHKVHQFVLEHLLRVEVGYEEGNVVTLWTETPRLHSAAIFICVMIKKVKYWLQLYLCND